VNGEWANWGSWNACSLTCGVGKQTRRRRCTDPSSTNGGNDCRGLKIETKNCFIRRCTPVHGKWTQWGKWVQCNTCGSSPAKQIRYRSCTNPAPAHHGYVCTGQKSETRHCGLSC
uniref:Uncharacterized protein n=1 Tax=Clytia hemisphaerica TaxID=252671 RepID=A0A7M5VAC9_9CNID